jgi:hypothetical protein
MISHEYKFIFIHPPKTGGSSIEESLNPLCEFDHPKHQYMCDIHYHFDNRKGDKKRFNEYFKFCSVRSPWARMFSLYKFYNRGESWNLESFRNFVNGRTSRNRGPDVQSVIDFCSIVKTIKEETQIGVDFFARLESFQEDFDTICDKINIKKRQVPHVYKTRNVNYRDFYDDELIETIRIKFQKDIDYFGYNFE